MTKYNKLTPEQFAELEPRLVSSKPIPRKVILSGSIIDLATVAANALPVLDSSLQNEKADQLSPMLDKLWEGEEVTPGSGQFSLLILRSGSREDGTVVGELHVELRTAPPALINLIHRALEASVELSQPSDYSA